MILVGYLCNGGMFVSIADSFALKCWDQIAAQLGAREIYVIKDTSNANQD